MAVRFDTNDEGLIRTANLPDYNATYTLMMWVYLAADLDAFGTIFYLGRDVTNAYDLLTTGADGVTLEMYDQGGPLGGSEATGTVLALNTWTHLALVRASPTAWSLYTNGVLDTTRTNDVGTVRAAPQRLEISAVTGIASRHFPGRVAGIKLWDTHLSAIEIAAEMHTLRPQGYANLNGWYPCWPGSGERTRDYSGHGRDWTEEGTLTDEDPPPVSYGAPVLWVPALPAGGAAPAIVFRRPRSPLGARAGSRQAS